MWRENQASKAIQVRTISLSRLDGKKHADESGLGPFLQDRLGLVSYFFGRIVRVPLRKAQLGTSRTNAPGLGKAVKYPHTVHSLSTANCSFTSLFI